MTMENDRLQESLDCAEIRRLIESWVFWRDACDWDRLRGAYAPDGRMSSGASSGTIDQFIAFSKTITSKASFRPNHVIGSSTIDVNGDKALAETRVIVLLRGKIQGIEVDVTAYGRQFDRLVRHEGCWRIKERTPIYDKDRLDPVHPGTSVVIDQAALDRYPKEYRHMCYFNDEVGTLPANVDLPTAGSAAEARLYTEAKAWLAVP